MPASQATSVGLTPYSVSDLHEHRGEAEDRVGRHARGGRDRLGQREEGAVDEAVAVDQEQALVEPRRLATGARTRSASHSRTRGGAQCAVGCRDHGAIRERHPSAQYRLTIRVEIADRPGMLGQVASAIGERRRDRSARSTSSRRRSDSAARHHGRRRRPGPLGARSSPRSTRVDGGEVIDTTDRTFLLHVGRQDRAAQQAPAEDARRPLDGLHAGRRARLHGDRRGPPTRRSSTRSSATRWPSSPTAPPCSASATSARRPRCR